MNSACNPIIYAWRSPSFREGYKEILCQEPSYIVSDGMYTSSLSPCLRFVFNYMCFQMSSFLNCFQICRIVSFDFIIMYPFFYLLWKFKKIWIIYYVMSVHKYSCIYSNVFFSLFMLMFILRVFYLRDPLFVAGFHTIYVCTDFESVSYTEICEYISHFVNCGIQLL